MSWTCYGVEDVDTFFLFHRRTVVGLEYCWEEEERGVAIFGGLIALYCILFDCMIPSQTWEASHLNDSRCIRGVIVLTCPITLVMMLRGFSGYMIDQLLREV
jgi:hypothetical protein